MGDLLVLTGIMLACAAMAAAEPFGKAEWLRDPIFKDAPILNVYHKEKAAKPVDSPLQNIHTLFRKEITLDAAPVMARLQITGDDYYLFYINGQYVAQGPESGYPSAHPYYDFDITPYLRAGANCLAAHVYYQGLVNRVWDSADNRSGFICSLETADANGKTSRFMTDATWKCLHLEAFPGNRTFGYKTQFAEDINMAAMPAGWRETGFNDAAWITPLTGRQDHIFAPQYTPPLQVYRIDPTRMVDKGNGNYFYEFPSEIVGCARIRLQGPAGHTLEVRHGEELSAPDTVRWEMRANCKYQEFPVLSGASDLIEFFDYKGFRYIEILNAPAQPEVWVDARHHRYPENGAQLSSSEPALDAIWTLCKNGVRWGAQGGFLDCPTREKGQYLGDALITGHSHLLLTGDASLTKKALHDFQLSQRICPGMMAVAPGSFMQEIAEYSLQWPLIVRQYYVCTNDKVFTEQTINNSFPPLFDYFARFESPSGLLTNMTEKWVLVDWPQNLRDDYDYDYAATRENTVLNAFYYGSLQTAATLLRDLGRDASALEARAARVAQAFQTQLWDNEQGLYVDAPGSKHASLHANALALRFGLATPDQIPNIIALIRAKRLSCGVYIAPFVIEACYRAGEPDLAYSLLTSDDLHSWREMLRNGATTCMEAWGPDQKKNASWCHPWSSSPIYLIIERVMGLTPAAPGWQQVRFAPRIPASLDALSITLPTPRGPLTAQYTRESGYTLTIPPSVTAIPEPPDGQPIQVLIANGLTNEQQAALSQANWNTHVPKGLGVWISIKDQMLRIIENGAIAWQAACATAARGAGAEVNSMQTPTGWHSVAEKTGDNAPWGQVFRSRKAVDQIWQPGGVTGEDLVLTRILALTGEEPGVNKGGRVDSLARFIYIHGTNAEASIGTPSSHGCIRLTNNDVIDAYNRIPSGTPVLITP